MGDVLRLYSKGDGRWESDDGRVEVVRDDTYETFCEDPHPVRYRLDSLDEGEKKRLPYDAKRRTKLTKKDGWVEYVSYECPGHESHYYSMWVPAVDDERCENVFDRFDHAVAEVERAMGVTVKLVRRKLEKPKTERRTTLDPNGGAKWVACGHRAELDVNEDCYTCHNSVEVLV